MSWLFSFSDTWHPPDVCSYSSVYIFTSQPSPEVYYWLSERDFFSLRGPLKDIPQLGTRFFYAICIFVWNGEDGQMEIPSLNLLFVCCISFRYKKVMLKLVWYCPQINLITITLIWNKMLYSESGVDWESIVYDSVF